MPRSNTRHDHDHMLPADVKRFSRSLADGTAGEYYFVLLLGLRTFDWAGVLHAIHEGLPYSAFERLSANSGLTESALCEWLQIPRRTVSRRQDQGRFAPDESERLVRAARLFGKALELFEGDREHAIEWLFAPQPAFAGQVPADVGRTEVGAREVEHLAGRLEHGVYS